MGNCECSFHFEMLVHIFFWVIIERKHCEGNIFFSQICIFINNLADFSAKFYFFYSPWGKKLFPFTLLWPTFSYVNIFKIPTATLVNDVLSEKI